MHPPATDWRATLKRRLIVAVSVLGFWAGAIELRLAYLQTVMRADLQARAESQHHRTPPAPAKRGDLVDRRGNVLATSVDADSVYAVPSELKDPELTVKRLCEALGDCVARERQRLLDRFNRQRAFAYVRRQISFEAARRVAALDLDGIGFIKESRRFYPNTQLAAHVLGYVGIDNNGLGGIESAYDSQIRGKAGTVLVTTDARGHVFSRVERPPTAGSSIELTVDKYLQHIAERELRAGVAANRAAGGSVIILDPSSGEILAMANEPTFNPNVFGESSEASRRNRAVQDLYEPGSTFKIVTASAAIEERVMPTSALIDTTPGILKIGTRVIDEFRGANHGVLSFTDVIVKSSNVGAVKIGFRLGADRFSRYVERFGFGRPISPDFPGESPGIVWSRDKWTEDAIASVSMGYQVGVTPLQMASAVSAIANGGELIEPRIVRAVYRDNRRYAVTPKVLKRAVEAKTAAAVTTIMEAVVTDGTAKLAQLDAYSVAGKTGTASKLIGGRYSATENNVSFVGFVPSRKPALTILVMIDAPHANGNSGGGVAAPIFKRIAEPAMRYLGIAPTVNPAPPVLVTRGEPTRVAAPQSLVSQTPVVTLVSSDRQQQTLPDLRGMSARDAMRTLMKLGVTARLSGQGFVLAQDPPPGTPVEAGEVCRLKLGRLPATVAAADAQP
jgi:cell division protein FtsI (penicillin-binding protein 3)